MLSNFRSGPWIQSHSVTHGRLALRVPLRTSLMLAVPVACKLRPGSLSGRLTRPRRVAFKLDRPRARGAAAAAMIGRRDSGRRRRPSESDSESGPLAPGGPGTGMITGIMIISGAPGRFQVPCVRVPVSSAACLYSPSPGLPASFRLSAEFAIAAAWGALACSPRAA